MRSGTEIFSTSRSLGSVVDIILCATMVLDKRDIEISIECKGRKKNSMGHESPTPRDIRENNSDHQSVFHGESTMISAAALISDIHRA